ncbi:MAG: hypothetical protein ABI534_11310 [Chloroflexota bacterium]
MLEKVLELLAALALAAGAAIPGLPVASDHVSKAADRIAAHASAQADKHADELESRDLDDETDITDEAGPGEDWSPPGLAVAAEAIEGTMENAPAQAQAGLQNALDQVQANAANDHGNPAH